MTHHTMNRDYTMELHSTPVIREISVAFCCCFDFFLFCCFVGFFFRFFCLLLHIKRGTLSHCINLEYFNT